MPYFRMKHTLTIDCIVRAETYEEAEGLSSCIRAVFEDEDGNTLPEDRNPLVSFEASSEAAVPDITECDENGNPIAAEEEGIPQERPTT
jgi:hypothetical protein